MSGRIVTEEMAKGIVEAYKRGDRILDIEEEFGVSRSSIYYVLSKSEIAPARAKTHRRLRGDNRDLVNLYLIIQAQEERIAVLEALLDENGIKVPSSPE